MSKIRHLPRTGRGGTFDYTIREFQVGDRVSLLCSDGYVAPLQNTATVVLRNGRLVWEPPEINCKLMFLLNGLPKTGKGGRFKPLGNAKPPYHMRDRVELECGTGYIRPSLNYVAKVVVRNGRLAWQPEELHCEPVRCHNPPGILFGHTSNENYHFDEKFKYVCDKGYVFNSPTNEFRCNEKGKWDPPLPWNVACVLVECPEFQVQNGRVLFNENRRFGTTASVLCDEGYVRSSGSDVRTCQADGTWDGTDTKCVLDVKKYYWTFSVVFFLVFLTFAVATLLLQTNYVSVYKE